MSPRPKLSLCIPTWNRASFLGGALESGLREAASQPPGTVEVLVCDNASSDDTPGVILKIQAAYPELQAFRNVKHECFDNNYLRCVEEARGEFVWIMGDDDVWLPGSIARVLRELEAGADACLCLAEACDMDLNPEIVLPWFLDSDLPKVWHLDSREALIHYFDGCARNAGVFAFISVAIFCKERFLRDKASLQRSIDTGYIHLWGMMNVFRQFLTLHYISEPLIRNRCSSAENAIYWAQNPLYGRWMKDLQSWALVADEIFGDDPELHSAFSHIIGRNHHDTILTGLRCVAGNETDWLDAIPFLLRAGFSSVKIAAVDFAFKHIQGNGMMPTLHPECLCLADLSILTRGARRIAVLVLGGRPNILDGADILASLKREGGPGRVRVLCTAEGADLLDGFEVQCVDPKCYLGDPAYRKFTDQSLGDFAPELVVNLDPDRGLEADFLVMTARPAGAIGYQLPERGQSAVLMQKLDGSYNCLIARDAGQVGILEALGLNSCPAAT